MLFGFIMAVRLGTQALGQAADRPLGIMALGLCTLQALYFVTDMAALW
ncbi:MAG: hypothetical protein JSU68_12315 [Phycisphaerales bacterium]|nr:MAG: hypothetical protein JSU68_12315 [Phycisphaerales bacterium]